MTIELVPGLNPSNIKFKLEERFINCVSVKGCVAYWSIGVNFFYLDALCKAIKEPNSFYCADIQLPTNIDNLAEYVRLGATEIYLHEYRLDPSVYNLNTTLLHSKIILFELLNGTFEIWIGSHNLTSYAINGLNLEASTVISCTKEDKIYIDTLKYLEEVRDKYCHRFDLNKIDIYKKLQSRDAIKDIVIGGGETTTEEVVTLYGENMENLETEDVIQLLSLNDKEFSNFKVVDKTIRLHTFDINTFTENLYVCTIAHSGRIDPKSPKLNIDFTAERRYAYIETKKIPFLKQPTKVTNSILHVAQYFVNLTIHYQINNFVVFEKPSLEELSLWQKDLDSPYRKRIYDDKVNKTIQVATYVQNLMPNHIDIKADWLEFRSQLIWLDKNLDKLIDTNYQSKGLRTADVEENIIALLYQERPNHYLLKKYTKSLIKRIILKLKEQDKSAS